MASFNIAFKPSVQKDFHRLPKSAVGRVVRRIEKLKDDPFPHGVDKLEGAERLKRRLNGRRFYFDWREPGVADSGTPLDEMERQNDNTNQNNRGALYGCVFAAGRFCLGQ